MATVAKQNLKCWQFNIKNAFTKLKLQENIYLTPPKGVTITKGKQLKVKRSLYGLKQASQN